MTEQIEQAAATPLPSAAIRARHRRVVLHTDGEGRPLVDLRATFGGRYRVSCEANGATWPREDWPWLYEIRGRFGIVHPRGGEILSAVIDAEAHPIQAAKLRKLPGAIRGRGGAELRVDFHVSDAEAVFKIIPPYRRRQVSVAQRDRLRAMGIATRFKRGIRHGVEVAAGRGNTHAGGTGHSTSRLDQRSRLLERQRRVQRLQTGG